MDVELPRHWHTWYTQPSDPRRLVTTTAEIDKTAQAGRKRWKHWPGQLRITRECTGYCPFPQQVLERFDESIPYERPPRPRLRTTPPKRRQPRAAEKRIRKAIADLDLEALAAIEQLIAERLHEVAWPPETSVAGRE